MNLNLVLKRSDNYLHNEVDNELVMMNVNTGSYASLNETAKFIWLLLDAPKSVELIVNDLCVAYNVTKEQCSDDLAPFLEKMLDQNIIEILAE